MSNTSKRKRWLRKFKSTDAEGFSRELNDGLSTLTDNVIMDNVNSLLLNYNAIEYLNKTRVQVQFLAKLS